MKTDQPRVIIIEGATSGKFALKEAATPESLRNFLNRYLSGEEREYLLTHDVEEVDRKIAETNEGEL